ncbi:HAD family hydrolase [Tolypothrix sp. NIES-4075]|nr:HAD family hydrolase [Tolypothrix sp. NIES-4075]
MCLSVKNITMTLQAVILDVDGTLVLSNDAHAKAWVEAFKDFGYEVSFDKVRPLIGMGGDQVVPKLVSELSDNEGEGKAIADRRKELIINKYAPNLPAANGSRQLLLKMKNEGLRLIIASSATSEELSLLLKAAQVDDLLEEATTSSDAESSKPAPDIVEAALKKLNMQPNEVVMLGDTPYDIQSASAAGVGVIAVRCGGFDDSQLERAIAIYNDPADILANYDNSPLSK